MARGRKPKPTQLKLLHGDDKKNPQRVNRNEPTPSDARPRCPSHLSAIAKTAWKNVCNDLEQMKLLTSTDAKTLELYCTSYAEWRAATDQIKKHGPVETLVDQGGNVTTRVSAWSRIQARKWDELTKLLIELGFTPAARTRLHVENGSGQQAQNMVMRRNRG